MRRAWCRRSSVSRSRSVVAGWGDLPSSDRGCLDGGVGGGEFAVEGCTGWRYVAEELTSAGLVAHPAEPAETATARGGKKRAKTDRADARLMRDLLVQDRLPGCWIPPTEVLEVRALRGRS
jgi:transposase